MWQKMSLFTELEKLYASLEEWQQSPHTTKDDVIRQCRASVGRVVSYLLATPHVGSGFCLPSDTLRIDALRTDLPRNIIVFESDATQALPQWGTTATTTTAAGAATAHARQS
jgi:hypothetical protein